MKQRLYSITVIFTILIITISIFIKSNHLSNIINFSINLFINNIFPSLFPMFIISSLLIEIDIPKVLGNITKKPINLLFKSKEEASFIFFMSMITGFPSSAKYIDDLIEKKQISSKDAEKILMFTFFSNPLFIINTIGISFLNSKYYGIIILISHVLGNILTGILFRNYNQNKIQKNIIKYNNLSHLNKKINETNIFKVLLKSIKQSLEILINIFGTITFFLIIINIIFNTPTNPTNIFLIGITEMTTGLKYLSLSNIDITIKIILSCFFISFGGLSIHFQIMSILSKRKVKYLPFLISRIIHALLSTVILIIIMKMDTLF